MEEEDIDFEVVDDFDNADYEESATHHTEPPPEPNDLPFAEPPSPPEEPDPLTPDASEIAEIITEAIQPLESMLMDLVQAHGEGMGAQAQANKQIITAINNLNESMQQVLSTPQNSTDPGTCNNQILPAAVSDEIDRLYDIEKAHEISKRAESALNYILDNDQISLKLPDDIDEQRLCLAILNGWHTKAYPNRPPLKLSQPASSSS